MNFERPQKPRTETPIKRIPWASSLSPFEAGLTAALRRAYSAPLAANEDEFDALLAKLV